MLKGLEDLLLYILPPHMLPTAHIKAVLQDLGLTRLHLACQTLSVGGPHVFQCEGAKANQDFQMEGAGQPQVSMRTPSWHLAPGSLQQEQVGLWQWISYPCTGRALESKPDPHKHPLPWVSCLQGLELTLSAGWCSFRTKTPLSYCQALLQFHQPRHVPSKSRKRRGK